MNETTVEKIPAFSILASIYKEIDEAVNYEDPGEPPLLLGHGGYGDAPGRPPTKRDRLPFWFAGGALSDLARGTMFKDIDVFTPNPALVLERLAECDIKPYYQIEGHVANFVIKGHTVQLVLGYSPSSPDAIIDLFDFTAVCGVYTPDGFTCHPRFWQDNATKRLVINNLPKPLSTLERITKYCRKGFRCCPIGLSRVARTINEMTIDWDNPKENEMQFYPDGTPRFMGID
jgi:hypothetical protein